MPWRADPHLDRPGRHCDRVRDRIDPYLDQDLAPAETREVEAHLAGCPDCRAELDLARRLRAAMREGLPMLSCPPEVSAEVLRVAREEAGRGAANVPHPPPVGRRPTLPLRRRVRELVRSPVPVGRRPALRGGALRPALAAAAVLLLLVAAPLLYRSVTGPEPEVAAGDPGPPYSAAEVARAEEEARLVLAYVASVGRDAGRAVQEEVFTLGLGQPTRRVMESLEAAGLAVAPKGAEGSGRREP